MCSARMPPFCTPEGAMKALSLRVGNQDEVHALANEIENVTVPLPNRDAPPVPVTQPKW